MANPEIDKIKEDIRELQNKHYSSVDLSSKVTQMDADLKSHKHTSTDQSSKFNSTDINAGTITVNGGARVEGGSNWTTVPLNIVDNTSEQINVVRRNFGAAINVINKGLTTEEIQGITGPGVSNIDSELYDFSKNNFTEVITHHQSGASLSFFDAVRTPLVNTGTVVSLTNGASVFTDTMLKLTTNDLAGCIINFVEVAPTPGVKTVHTIASNTSTTITVTDTFSEPTGTYTYVVYLPVYLGSADYPWRRLYVDNSIDGGKDIRIGLGTSAGTGVIWIAHGAGSPEGVVTANPGSLYMDTAGGLNLKRTGVGTNTGWLSISSMGKFGGTGADGAFSNDGSSGPTTISVGTQAVFTKNYSSVSITGTGQLLFSGGNDGGTLVILKCSGNATITSSTAPCISVVGLGALGGIQNSNPALTTDGSNSTDILDTGSHFGYHATGTSTNPGAGGSQYSANMFLYTTTDKRLQRKSILIVPGCGGGPGYCTGAGLGWSITGGPGGRGGGALIIEVAGTLTFTTANGISVAGAVGGDGGPAYDDGTLNASNGGGGGGGGGGMAIVLYNIAGTLGGSINVSGGYGGLGGYNSGSGGGDDLVGGAGGGGGGSYLGAAGAGGVGFDTTGNFWTSFTPGTGAKGVPNGGVGGDASDSGSGGGGPFHWGSGGGGGAGHGGASLIDINTIWA